MISRNEGEALEIVRGAERELGLEQWRRLAALYDPLAAGRSLDDSRQILFPPKAAKRDELSHAIQAKENLEQRHRERTGDQLLDDMRLAILLSMCPADLEKELTAQQHLFPDSAHMKAHVVTVINSRSRGLAPVVMGNLSDEDSSDEPVECEDGELYRLEIRNGKKVFTKSRLEPSKGKGGGKGKTDRECFRCGSITSEQTAEPKLTSTEDLKNLRPKRKVLEIARTKKQRLRKMCRWRPSRVTIGNMSIDNKLVATDGERGRYRENTVDSGAGESVLNPDDWPNIDLKTSKGSVKGQRYVGLGGEKIDNL